MESNAVFAAVTISPAALKAILVCTQSMRQSWMTPSPSTSTATKVVSAWALPSASAVAALELLDTTETSARPVFS